MFRLLTVLILIAAVEARATEYFDTHTNARAMGMGGAYAAIVDTEDSLWFNPAGIAKNSGVYWTIADPHAGVSNLDAITSLADLGDASTFATALDDLYGEPIWVGGGGKTSIMIPFFAASYFYDTDASVIVDNPVNPNLELNYITDTGYAIGTGWTMAGVFQMGFAAKYITRTGVRKTYGAQTIANIVSGGASPDVIFDEVTDTTGKGYALDMGMNFTFPTPIQPTLSFVWKNIGNTKFTPASGETAPPTEPSAMTIGAGLMIDVPLISIAPVIEFRHLNDAEEQIGKKLHVGFEIDLPLITARAGFYQGYFTYGAGLDFGLFQIDAASWGTELGGYPGQFESRRFMVQLTMRLGLDLGMGGGGSGKGKDGKGGGSSGKSGSGKKRAKKQRR